ncbi:S26 family signal peptidase [Phytomonospora endophytica]|uniref:Uncharacterized protein n=1 Tax=Phytomonospora endophytica TaxID=714109 RepID=A0A841G151_9ACTN|nr:S26 family signal peptidase [Phytomonospora endophytica]MBB6037890.1 hypothetical protein [Phytomonospora endophytica]GIG68790.1 hypothetical protein Pen01_50850 [Phytomonospora endophytica]
MTAAAAALVRRALARLGRAVIDVAGTSMAPTIVAPARVTLTARRFENVVVGDVAAYLAGEDIVVHRVVHRDADRLFTAGDARRRVDPAAHRGDFLGVVEGLAPFTAPSPMKLVPAPTGAGPAAVRLWVFEHGATWSTTDTDGLTVTRLPRAGIGADPGVVERLRAETTGSDLRIGVCQSARDGIELLTALDLTAYGTVDVVTGVGFTTAAPPLADGTVLLPEDLAHVFVRTAPLGEWPTTAWVTETLVPQLSPVPAGPAGRRPR